MTITSAYFYAAKEVQIKNILVRPQCRSTILYNTVIIMKKRLPNTLKSNVPIICNEYNYPVDNTCNNYIPPKKYYIIWTLSEIQLSDIQSSDFFVL